MMMVINDKCNAEFVSYLYPTLKALHGGMSVDQIHQLTAIDKWFLHKLHRITELEKHLAHYKR